MKIAFINRGQQDTVGLIPKDVPHVLIVAPENNTYTPEQMRQVADCDAIYVSGAYITEQVFEAGKKLRMVQTAGAGFDKLDLAAATRHGVVCCNNGDLNSSRVADFCMTLLLTQFRRYIQTVDHMKTDNWEQARSEGVQALEVEDKTIGIIGFGSIGAKLGKRAHAFDMKVVYNDILPDVNQDVARRIGARLVSKEELYRTADVISINTPLNESTRGLIGAKEIAMMKDGAYLICTARGNIVDETALRKALDEGKLAGAGIDVFSTEPIKPDNPLLGAKNIALSPHVAGRGKEGVVRSFNASMENIRRYVALGQPPRNVLNAEAMSVAAAAH